MEYTEKTFNVTNTVIEIRDIQSMPSTTEKLVILKSTFDVGAVKQLSKRLIKILYLVNCSLTREDWMVLLTIDSLKILSHIGGSKLEQVQFKRLINLTQLRELTLVSCEMSPEGIAAISQLKRLEVLDLSERKMVEEEAIFLKQLTRLRKLSLNNCHIDDYKVHFFSFIQRLAQLWLCGNLITYEGAESIAKHTSLKHLFISQNPLLEVKGAMRISTLRRLDCLNLYLTSTTQRCREVASRRLLNRGEY